MSKNTVKTQALAIYRKLGVRTRSDAVEYARQLGLLEETQITTVNGQEPLNRTGDVTPFGGRTDEPDRL